MSELVGVMRYEYRMSIRRWGLWLAFGLALAASLVGGGETVKPANMAELWTLAARLPFQFNLWIPVVVGIAVADRLVRDEQIKTREMILSTQLSRWGYLLGKYFGNLLAMLTPALGALMAMSLLWVVMGGLPVILLMTGVAFLAIIVPAYVFVTAFSLVCPLVMPTRVYQVLFTGYWFWGNYLSPKAFPTLSGTWLTPCGKLIYQGYFGGHWSMGPLRYTATDATLSVMTMAFCAALVLLAAERFLAWRQRVA